jgi:cell shape-determining protein MreC
MMKGYRSNRVYEWRDAALVVALVVVVLVVLFLTAWIRDLVVRARVGSEALVGYALTPRSVLIERLDRAESALLKGALSAALYEHTVRERDALRAELALRPESAYAVARVASAPPRTHYDTLAIARGAEDGVLEGDVATHEGVAFGTVSALSPHAAVVELYSSPGRAFDIALGEPRAITVVRGLGGGALEATVPDSVLVEVGDPVEEPVSGLVFGTVRHVEKRAVDTTLRVRIALIVSPATLTHVSLIHRPQ